MHEQTTLKLTLTARPTVTVLPRCLQILSRRGYRLTQLSAEEQRDGLETVHLVAVGPSRWHPAIPNLIARLVDVQTVTAEEETHA